MIDRARAARALEAAGLDALVATTLENVYYATGVATVIDELGVLAFAVVPREPERRVALVVPAGQLAVVAQAPPDGVDLYPYGRFVVDRSGGRRRRPRRRALPRAPGGARAVPDRARRAA